MLVLIAVLVTFLVVVIASTPAPQIEAGFGGATVDLRADRAWVFVPGQCVTVSWSLEGIQSLYIDGGGKIGWGEESFCPSLDATSPIFEITAQNGDYRAYSLDIRYLPLALIGCLVVSGIVVLLILAFYFFLTQNLAVAVPLRRTHAMAYVALLTACLLCETGNAFSIKSIVVSFSNTVINPSWQLFGLALVSVVYMPLIILSIRNGLKNKSWADLAAIGGFFVFLLFLNLPFGIDSIGHWEEWVVNAWFDGRPSKLSNELIVRYWVLVPHALANLISSESFAGYHIVNLLMFQGKLALLYGILRKLKFAPFYAFLIVILTMVYPVNSALMSLRSFPLTFNMLAFLTALYLILDFMANPGRLRLAGIWLALILNVTGNESAFALLLLVPLMWWYFKPQSSWQKINLTAVWYLFPAIKVFHIMLLLYSGISFYRSDLILNFATSDGEAGDIFNRAIQSLATVYRNSFAPAWSDALAAWEWSAWAGWLIVVLITVSLFALLISRVSDRCVEETPSIKRAGAMTIGGILLIAPSVGVLIWFEALNEGLWRTYFYVPIGAALAVLGLIIILTSPLRDTRWRQRAIYLILVAMLLPATNRIFLQHEIYESSANRKAKILLEMVELAPALHSEAVVIMLSDLSMKQMLEDGIVEFESNMLDSALYTLYEDKRPRFGFLCIVAKRCHPNDISLIEFRLDSETDFSNLVLFRLFDDLRLELLGELPPELDNGQNDTYNPYLLIDTSAPVPPRALTMLASARRSSTDS